MDQKMHALFFLFSYQAFLSFFLWRPIDQGIHKVKTFFYVYHGPKCNHYIFSYLMILWMNIHKLPPIKVKNAPNQCIFCTIFSSFEGPGSSVKSLSLVGKSASFLAILQRNVIGAEIPYPVKWIIVLPLLRLHRDHSVGHLSKAFSNWGPLIPVMPSPQS